MAALQAETGAANGVDLEAMVAQVELRLQDLSASLRERDAGAIEQASDHLHRALARAVASFMFAARHGGVPNPMRSRLGHASAQLARQRESLARATAALDRAIDVLMPGSQSGGQAGGNRLYAANGRLGSAGGPAGSAILGAQGMALAPAVPQAMPVVPVAPRAPLAPPAQPGATSAITGLGAGGSLSA